MLVGKALIHFKRCVFALEMLRCYCDDNGATLWKARCWLVRTYTRLQNKWAPVCVC